MRISVTDLDQLAYYRQSEDMELQEIIDRLERKDFVKSRAMQVGTAWHSVLETAIYGDLISIERDGVRFAVKFDTALELPELAEVKGEKSYVIDGMDVVLSGRVDCLTGLLIQDHKATGRPDPERYFESMQWRAYLTIFGADVFEYFLWHVDADKDPVPVLDLHRFKLYRYPDMESDLHYAVSDFVSFARHYLPSWKKDTAAW